MELPDVLTDKTLGLPRWAWLALIAGGITVGLVLRKRAADKAASDPANDPNADSTDQSNITGDAALADMGTGDGSAAYSPTGYAPTGFTYGGAQGYGGAGSGIATPATEITINAGTLPSASTGTDPTATAVTPSGGCSDGKKPLISRPGYHLECVDNKWIWKPNKRTGTDTPPMTGGGPPNRPANKNPGHAASALGGSVAIAGPGAVPTKQQHPSASDTGVPSSRPAPTVGKNMHTFKGNNGHWWKAPNAA